MNKIQLLSFSVTVLMTWPLTIEGTKRPAKAPDSIGSTLFLQYF